MIKNIIYRNNFISFVPTHVRGEYGCFVKTIEWKKTAHHDPFFESFPALITSWKSQRKTLFLIISPNPFSFDRSDGLLRIFEPTFSKTKNPLQMKVCLTNGLLRMSKIT
jgi:hypothetical protein